MAEEQHNPRRWTSDYFVVFDRDSNEPLGRVLNFSDTGLLLMSAEPIKVPQVLFCRLLLPHPVNGVTEIFFDAESRWTRHNAKADWYETGFHITAMAEQDHRLYCRLVPEEDNAPSGKAPRST
ncbi:PilZ domain-containing protein [bacterium]|nr:PilZ domain-containing protein [bacterium]